MHPTCSGPASAMRFRNNGQKEWGGITVSWRGVSENFRERSALPTYLVSLTSGKELDQIYNDCKSHKY